MRAAAAAAAGEGGWVIIGGGKTSETEYPTLGKEGEDLCLFPVLMLRLVVNPGRLYETAATGIIASEGTAVLTLLQPFPKASQNAELDSLPGKRGG